MADLIADDILRACFAHPGLPACLVALLKKLLKDRHQEILKQGDIPTAGALARLAARDEVAGAVYELNRRRDTLTRDPLLGDYLRPTVDAVLWRDTQLRRAVRADPQACLLRAHQSAARHESSWRACIFIALLSELAKMTTQFPDDRAVAKVASGAREAADEWRASEALYTAGLPDQAELHKRRAFMHLLCARILAREYAREYRDKLLLVTWWRLTRHFGFNGYRIAAALVSAALERDKPISRSHTRHVVKIFLRRLENRRAIS
jgi:hypothetical protein